MKSLLPIGMVLAVASATAQQLPSNDSRVVRFEVTEGTAMNVDVSKDGRTIVFDLLGDIYRVPFAGGNAQRITTGPAFDAQPVFSADGQQIAFVSDRDGAANIWVADANGQQLR